VRSVPIREPSLRPAVVGRRTACGNFGAPNLPRMSIAELGRQHDLVAASLEYLPPRCSVRSPPWPPYYVGRVEQVDDRRGGRRSTTGARPARPPARAGPKLLVRVPRLRPRGRRFLRRSPTALQPALISCRAIAAGGRQVEVLSGSASSLAREPGGRPRARRRASPARRRWARGSRSIREGRELATACDEWKTGLDAETPRLLGHHLAGDGPSRARRPLADPRSAR